MTAYHDFLARQAEVANAEADRRFFAKYGFKRNPNYRKPKKEPDLDDLGELPDWPWELVVARAERDLAMAYRWRREMPADHPNQAHFAAIGRAAQDILRDQR